MARVKVGFKVGDKIVYKGVTERIVGKIVTIMPGDKVMPGDGMRFYEIFVIEFTTNRARTYRKGDRIETTSAFLNKR